MQRTQLVFLNARDGAQQLIGRREIARGSGALCLPKQVWNGL